MEDVNRFDGASSVDRLLTTFRNLPQDFVNHVKRAKVTLAVSGTAKLPQPGVLFDLNAPFIQLQDQNAAAGYENTHEYKQLSKIVTQLNRFTNITHLEVVLEPGGGMANFDEDHVNLFLQFFNLDLTSWSSRWWKQGVGMYGAVNLVGWAWKYMNTERSNILARERKAAIDFENRVAVRPSVAPPTFEFKTAKKTGKGGKTGGKK